MGWTKQALIEQAYGELALAGHAFDLDADTRQNALVVMDTMLAEWFDLGIGIGYALPSSPEDSNIGDDAGIPASAAAAIWQSLAMRLAAGHGKALTPQTIASATGGYNRLLGTAVAPAEQQASGLPLGGAGNKPWRGM